MNSNATDSVPNNNTSAPSEAPSDLTAIDSTPPKDQEDQADLPHFLVGIGASAGGLESLEKFFRAMPEDSGLTFVVIQHLSPDFKSLMDELLERFNRMPVIEIEQRVKYRPNCIYLVKPGKELTIDDDYLVTHDRSRTGPLFLPINTFFRSLAANWAEKAIAIVLSGSGSDGTNGILDIRDAGGMVIAESPDTAHFASMPQSVINTGCADAILAPEEIPEYLIRYVNDPQGLQLFNDDKQQTSGTGIPAILELLKNAYRIDFNHYKPGTITRRIERRLLACAPNRAQSLTEYCEQLKNDPEALDFLYKDLLIGVTRFFRDPEAFDILSKKVLPDLIKALPENQELRVWICGCSTGEEAYSLAIVLMEEFTRQHRPIHLKILATDLHDESIQTAAQGIYHKDSLDSLPSHFLKRYFEPVDDGYYKVLPEVRKLLIFSRHNLLNDPPFTKIHLVSCRNLLIYLQQSAQLRAIASFHYALTHQGILFLGASESLGDLLEEFDVIDRQSKLFRKVRERRMASTIYQPGNENLRLTARVNNPVANPLLSAYDGLLKLYVPDGLLLNEGLEIVHIFGNAKNYIKADSGRLTGHISSLLPKDFLLPLLTAQRNASKSMQPTTLHGICVQETYLQITVQPFYTANKTIYYMVAVQEDQPELKIHPPAPEDINLQTGTHEYINDLENELRRTRETLQATVEELETSNEELQASNEELLASNEELQSTNEELHSVNEELYSVNAEHELKIDELNQTSADLRNLIHSTDTATIFVDANWHIRLFTPKTLTIFNLLSQDIGRDIRHFKSKIADEWLYEDLENCMLNGDETTRLIQSPDHRNYLRRCARYADLLAVNQGAVINYMDITSFLRSNQAIDESEAHFEMILQTTPNAILVLDRHQVVIVANKRAEYLFSSPKGLLLGQKIERLIGAGKTQSWGEFSDSYTQQDQDYTGWFEAYRLDGQVVPVEISLGQIIQQGNTYLILVIVDMTQRKKAEQLQMETLQKARSLAEARSFFLARMSHEVRTPLTSILGASNLGLLKNYALDNEKHQQLFEKIKRSSEHLLQIINDVLDFSKIDAGIMVIKPVHVELIELLRDCVNEVRYGAEAKKLDLQFITGNLPTLPCVTDPTRIRQMVMTLLTNAIKFTEKGFVHLDVQVDQIQRMITVRVSDSGIGIAEERQSHIFKPFEQVNSTISPQNGGTGLGLSIASNLAVKLGGTLELYSQEGVGTTFTLNLPLITPLSTDLSEQHNMKAITDNCLQDVTLLLVEDDEFNRNVIQEQLHLLGATIIEFTQGQHLIDHITQHGSKGIDAVLMDLEMPVMDGYEATAQLKQQAPDLPVIALTAHVLNETQKRCLACGMVAYVKKPVVIEELVQAIQEIL